MEASILDLRYKMKEVLETKVKEHPFFGMNRKDKRSANEVMGDVRRGRYDAL